MKSSMSKNKKVAVKSTEKALVKIADIFASAPCVGFWYEPKVPENLKK